MIPFLKLGSCVPDLPKRVFFIQLLTRKANVKLHHSLSFLLQRLCYLSQRFIILLSCWKVAEFGDGRNLASKFNHKIKTSNAFNQLFSRLAFFSILFYGVN